MAPMYLDSVTPSEMGILAAMIAAGGTPKANAHGASFSIFFHC